MSTVQFLKVVPHLHNPFVLVGLGLFIIVGIWKALLKKSILAPLSQRQSAGIIRMVLKHGLRIAVVLILCGFGYAGYRARLDASHAQGQQGPVEQRSGACGANVNGTNNATSVDCSEKTAPTK